MGREGESRQKRHSVYYMIVLVALALAAGRIAVVKGKDGATAFLSANDRSRWCTVACLVEQGTYAIDRQIAITDPVMRNRRPWNTIDMVRHTGSDGQLHYYSSKPPLLPTLVAGVYKVANVVTGMTLTEQPIYMGRIVLALVNLPLLGLFFFGTIGAIDRLCHSDWTRLIAACVCCFGTMVFPFAISLNNHLPAASATALTMWIYLFAAERLDEKDSYKPNTVPFLVWVLAGVGAAMAAANELPALSMTVFWMLLFAKLSRLSILPFAAGVIIVAVGFFGTNWIAHQSLRPPYAHRGNGPVIADLKSAAESPDDPQLLQELRGPLLEAGADLNDDASIVVEPSDEEQRWLVMAGQRQFALLKSGSVWQLAEWDDWYEYPGTYWKDGRRVGVDQGEPSRAIYFAHMTIGHHGIFSLTPIWLLVPIGLVVGLGFGPSDYRRLTWAILIATVVCMAFYVARPLVDRNYGGVSICFRWMLWFAPLWLLVIAPVIQKMSESLQNRIIVHVLLALSVFSMAASLDSPWQSPWLYRFWDFLGWIGG